MSSDYQHPEWAETPRHVWMLQEIKEGVVVAEHRLKQACMLLGRAADQVDIPLHHESCSRQHARIAFDQTGTPWLRDLQSTHGTAVNKKKLPGQAIGKVESNSTKTGARGVVLFPGDLLQFGASTRIFCLDGPDEFARGATRKVVPKAVTTAASQSTTCGMQQPAPNEKEQRERQSEEGVSWGISMDDEIDNPAEGENSERLPLDLADDKIPEKHRKEWDRLRALRYKLDHIQTESDRIRCKGELTQGQERQLQRNEERQSKLEDEIKEKEAELYRKLYPDRDEQQHAARRQQQQQEFYGADEDVDDFYDRTKAENLLQINSDGETEQSLTAKWKSVRSERVAILADLSKAEQQVSQKEDRLALLRQAGDEEAFFLQNDLDLAKDTAKKLKDRNRKLEKQLAETERMLKIANPSLNVDLDSGYIGKDPVPSITFPSMTPPPPIQADAALPSKLVMPSPPSIAPAEQPAMEDSGTTDFGGPMPPPKRKRIVGPSAPPKGLAPAFEEPRDEKPSVKGAPIHQPTLAVLSSIATDKGPSDDSFAKQKKKKKEGEQTVSTFDVKKDVWTAPKDQDGSGFTKLNAKFAGRY